MNSAGAVKNSEIRGAGRGLHARTCLALAYAGTNSSLGECVADAQSTSSCITRQRSPVSRPVEAMDSSMCMNGGDEISSSSDRSAVCCMTPPSPPSRRWPLSAERGERNWCDGREREGDVWAASTAVCEARTPQVSRLRRMGQHSMVSTVDDGVGF